MIANISDWTGILGFVFSIISFIFINKINKNFKKKYENHKFRNQSKKDLLRSIKGIYVIMDEDNMCDWHMLNDLVSHISKYKNLTYTTKKINRGLKRKLLKMTPEPNDLYFLKHRRTLMSELKTLEYRISDEADEILSYLD